MTYTCVGMIQGFQKVLRVIQVAEDYAFTGRFLLTPFINGPGASSSTVTLHGRLIHVHLLPQLVFNNVRLYRASIFHCVLVTKCSGYLAVVLANLCDVACMSCLGVGSVGIVHPCLRRSPIQRDWFAPALFNDELWFIINVKEL